MVRMRDLIESFFSKIEEKLLDYGLDSTGRSINDIEYKVKSLKINAKLLSAKAYDVEQHIKNAELSGSKKRKREVENWLKEVKVIESEFLILSSEEQEEGFISRFFGGDQTVNLNAIVLGLLETSQHFGELALDDYETKGKPLLTSVMFGEAFNKKLNRILKCVVVDKVQTIGIYGMGGVGKTTLAKHIHNRLLNETQDNVYWITISQEFSIKKLQDDIAKLMSLDLSNQNDEDKRAATLNRALSQRKHCVLILDDVWENIDLEKIGDPLLVEGCRLIITTRSLEVCHRIGCQETIEVKTLESDEAWNLFKVTLGHYIGLAPQVQEIAKLVAEQCDGLPLGIVTLAKTMRGMSGIHEWRNALTELKESCMGQLDEMEEKVFGVLQYSFNRLDPKLKPCFLYCCLYPEDYSIPKEYLISYFISEELMDKRKSMTSQFDLGHDILNKLLNLCLLESEGRDRYLKMHDLVRAMALKIARNNHRFMVLAGLSLEKISNEEEWTKDLEKVSFMFNKITKIPPEMAPNCPRLTTLLLNHNLHLDFIPESFFVHMSSLCVLDLSYTSIKELPNTLSDLESLNTLLLRGCRKLICVPYLGKLKELKELDLSITVVKEVPQGMEYLVNLKSFSIGDNDYVQMLPTNTSVLHKFPNFRNLQRLILPSKIKMKIEEIKLLKELEEFGGRFKDVCDLNEFSKSREHLRYPTFYHVHLGGDSIIYDDRRIDYRRVRVVGCSFKREEGEDAIILPQDVQQLQIKFCKNLSSCFLDEFPLSNISTSLETLEITNCEGIEYILKANDQQLNMVEEGNSLQSLRLVFLPDLEGVTNWEVGVALVPSPPPKVSLFSSLKTLEIFNCKKIKKLGLPLAYFQNIESIKLWECEEIEEIIQVPDTERGGIISLPNLRYLHLDTLPNLKCICNGATMSCISTEEIWLKKCRNMKKLPLFLSCSLERQSYYPPPSLKKILVDKEDSEWWESLDWEQPSHKNVLQPFVQFV